jgi:hypothetical protein
VTKYNTKIEAGKIMAARVILSSLAAAEIVESLYSVQPASKSGFFGF